MILSPRWHYIRRKLSSIFDAQHNNLALQSEQHLGRANAIQKKHRDDEMMKMAGIKTLRAETTNFFFDEVTHERR